MKNYRKEILAQIKAAGIKLPKNADLDGFCNTIVKQSLAVKVPVKDLVDEFIQLQQSPQPLIQEPENSPAQAITEADVQKVLTPQEAIRIAYYPIITGKAAFRHAFDLRQICIDRRLPYARQSRIIKESYEEWNKYYTDIVDNDTMKKLEDQLEDFLAGAGWDVQCLWFTVNQELKKRYPELNAEYDLLTPLYVCISLMDFTRQKESEYADLLEERTGIRPAFPEQKSVKKLRAALNEISGKYSLDATPMIKLAIGVINNRLQELVFNDVERVNDEW